MSEAKHQDYEDIIQVIGGVGLYQVYTNIMLLFIVFGFGTQVGFMIFGAVVPPNEHIFCGNQSVAANATIVMENCTDINFADHIFHSIAMEWRLLGKDRYFVTVITSMQMVGILVGSLVIGTFSDRFGRKPAIIGTTLCTLIFSFATAFSTDWITFSILRTINGAFAGAAIISGYCYVAEVLPPKWRLFCTAGYQWVLSFIWLALLGKFAGHWRVLSFAISGTTIPAFFMSLVLVENPKWLIERKRFIEGQNALFAIAKWNRKLEQSKQAILNFIQDEKIEQGVHYVETVMEARLSEPRGSIVQKISAAAAVATPKDFVADPDHDKEKKTYTYCDLFYNKTATIRAIVYAYSWFSAAITAYGLSYNLSHLAGDTSENIFICCAIELISATILIILDRKWTGFGRRHVHQIGLASQALSTFLLAVFYAVKLDEQQPWSVRGVSFFGYGMCSFVWTPVVLYGFELFPTILRNTGMAMGSTVARIGACLSPQILAIYYIWKPGPFVVYTTAACINIILAMCFLPETKNQPLPDIRKEISKEKQKKLNV